jgi:hypothetical protein
LNFNNFFGLSGFGWMVYHRGHEKTAQTGLFADCPGDGHQGHQAGRNASQDGYDADESLGIGSATEKTRGITVWAAETPKASQVRLAAIPPV